MVACWGMCCLILIYVDYTTCLLIISFCFPYVVFRRDAWPDYSLFLFTKTCFVTYIVCLGKCVPEKSWVPLRVEELFCICLSSLFALKYIVQILCY